MPSYEARITIAAPSADVWRVLSDVVAWPQWLQTVVSVRALDAEPLAEGNRYEIRQPHLRRAIWVVTSLAPLRRFVWRSRSPGFSMIADHVIDARPSYQTHVTVRFSFSGWLGTPVGLMYRSLTQIYLAQETAALKRTVEGAHPGSHAR